MSQRIGEFWRRLGFARRRHELDRDLQEEMAFHLEMRAASKRTAGLSGVEARAEAQRAFGNRTQLRELSREQWGWPAIEQFAQDLRHAFRGMRKAPTFAAAAILTLALGIGANVAVFSIVEAVLLRPLPYRDAERLMTAPVSIPDFRDLESSTRVFDDLALWASNQYSARIQDEAEQILGAVVSERFFPMLGQAALGRTFGAGEAYATVAVISHSLWMSHFGATPGVLGRTMRLNGDVYTVIGVMPPEFQFPSSQFKFWVPLGPAMAAVPAQAQNRAFRIFRAVAHRRSGATPAQVQAEMQAFSQRLARDYPDTNAQVQIRFVSVAERLLGDVKPVLAVLMATAGLVLLIACANVANLMLARAVGRAREFTVRAALGAGRWRLVRQSLTESFAIAAVGAVVGLALAHVLIGLLPRMAAADLPRISTVRINAAVLVFASALCALATLLFGLTAAIRAVRGESTGKLREGSRGTGDSTSGRRVRSALIAGEMALACVVLVAAGLLLKSFVQLVHVDAGFVAENLLTMNVGLVSYKDPQRRAMTIARALENLARVPGVTYAGGSTGLPPVTPQRGTRFAAEGRILEPAMSIAYFISASPHFFEAAGTPIVEGRTFAESDAATAAKVVVINDQLARRLYPNESAVGKRLKLINPEQSGEWRSIVGVVRTIRYAGLEEADQPAIYTPFAQNPMLWMYVMVRHTPNAPDLIRNVRAAIAGADGNLAPMAMQPMDAVLWETVARPRFRTALVSGFAIVALLLAAIGIYGVIAYSVSQRVQELGVRLAVGATRADVIALVLGDSARLCGAALLLGLPAAFAAGRALNTMLFQVSPGDISVFAGVAGILTVVALGAAWFPARRAARLDPLSALRYE